MSAFDPAEWIGSTIDRYVLEAPLGLGGFGAVYRARHDVTGRLLAVKILIDRSDDMTARFLQEARAASAIGNPHIVGVTDAGRAADGRHFIAMELLDGETLEDVLERDRRLPLERAAHIANQLLDALAAAHAAGVVHRDLKPSNLFLTRDPRGAGLLKVLDFGISKVRRPDVTALTTQPGRVMGTVRYMAPEQFRGNEHTDHRTDIYSASTVLYEALAGVHPFDASSFEHVMIRICTEPALGLCYRAPDVSPAVGAVIDRGLAKNPVERWSSASEMRHALVAAVEASPPIPPTVDRSHPHVPSARSAPEVSTARLENRSEGHVGSQPRRAVVVGVLVATAGVAAVAVLVALLSAAAPERRPETGFGGTSRLVPGTPVLPTRDVRIDNRLQLAGCSLVLPSHVQVAAGGNTLLLHSPAGGRLLVTTDGRLGELRVDQGSFASSMVLVRVDTPDSQWNSAVTPPGRGSRLTITEWDLANLRFDLTFDGVMLRGEGNTTCYLSGRLRAQ